MNKKIIIILLAILTILLSACNKQEELYDQTKVIFDFNGGTYCYEASFNIDKYETQLSSYDNVIVLEKNNIDESKLNFDRIFLSKTDKTNIYEIVGILVSNESWAKGPKEYDYVIVSTSECINKDNYKEFFKVAKSFNSIGKYLKLEKNINDINNNAKVYLSVDEALGFSEVMSDSYIEFKDAYKNAYNFIGWFDSNGNKVTGFDFEGKKEYVVRAMYEAINYTISYNTNGGVINDKIESYTFESDNLRLPVDVKKDDYVFDGWYLDTNYQSEKIEYINKGTYGNMDLYAKWVTEEVSVLSNQGRVEKAIEEVNKYFDSLNEVESDIILPLNEELTSVKISWESNNKNILDDNGVYHRDYKDTKVTYKATFTYLDYTKDVTFEVLAKGYKDISKNAIASSYIYRNYGNLVDNFFDTLDIITCAFTIANANANLNGTSYFDQCRKLIIPKAHEKGCYVIMSIAPESDWETIANPNNNLVDKFADNIVNAINTYGFDGVDIDWECPSSTQKSWFTSLVKKVNEKVKRNNPNHLVTAAIGGGQWQPPMYEMDKSAQYLDFINMMTYGMCSSDGYYHNSLYANTSYNDSVNKVGRTMNSCSIQESIDIYLRYNVPKRKIIVGLAFYGMKQERTYNESTKTYSNWKKAGSVYYTNIKNNYLNNANYKYVYDTRCGVPYIISKDGLEFITFDDPRGVKEKCNYTLTYGLGGVTFWEYGCDTTGDLVSAIQEAFNGKK